MLFSWTGKAASRALARLAAMGLALAMVHCGAGNGAGANAPSYDRGSAHAARMGEAVAVPGIVIAEGHTVGPPLVIGNLAVFPIYAERMEDLGDFTTLADALERGTAVVRELDGEPGQGEQRAHVDGARVNTLVIENKGELPILVLAGTVVKGGKQDRQIGQDFIIGARETVPVDAFCVEHGRWNAVRDGVSTGGKFRALKMLANGEVRQAGQYEKDQSQVWSKVGKINKDQKRETASDTLTASLEDGASAGERDAAAAKIEGFLKGAPVAGHVVGMAYAVDGEVQGVRWFLSHKLFEMYKETLVTTAAVESIAARAAAKAAGKPAGAGACPEDAVAKFVTSVASGRVEQRDTGGANVNAYQFSDEVYAAEAVMKGPPGAKAPPKQITKDFLKKKK